MSWTNRLIGFGICTGLAILLIVIVSYNTVQVQYSSSRIQYLSFFAHFPVYSVQKFCTIM